MWQIYCTEFRTDGKINVEGTDRNSFSPSSEGRLLLRRFRWNLADHIKKKLRTYLIVGRVGSSVGIATDYGLDDPRSNPSWDEIFRPSRPALGPTQPHMKWVLSLSCG